VEAGAASRGAKLRGLLPYGDTLGGFSRWGRDYEKAEAMEPSDVSPGTRSSGVVGDIPRSRRTIMERGPRGSECPTGRENQM